MTLDQIDRIHREPPASPEAIAAASRSLHAPLPDVYARLLALAEGLEADTFVLYGCGALAERNETFEVAEYAPDYVTIGDDNGGRALMLQGGRDDSAVFLVDHGSMDPACMTRLADSFAAWVSAGGPLTDA